MQSSNIFKLKGEVSPADRERLHGHKGAVVWFTGLSASGKSTCAHRLEKILHDRGCSTYVFDGDNVRMGLCRDLGFSEKDRVENIRRIGEMVRLFVDAGIIAITAFISPYRRDRERVRSSLAEGRFLEVFMDCPLDVCASRDKKGIYEKARAGLIKDFTGISSPYEPPQEPELTVRSYREDAGEAVIRIAAYMEERGIIPPGIPREIA
jgi:adenylylsulfate kinase